MGGPMYNTNDFNFGISGVGSPTLSGSGAGGFGVNVPNYGATAGASNPVGTYLQSSPQMSNNPNFSTGAGGIGGMGGLGFNLDTGKLALGGLQTIGSLWQAFEANKLAKEQFKFQKEFANANLANQIQSYNTTLEDRGR